MEASENAILNKDSFLEEMVVLKSKTSLQFHNQEYLCFVLCALHIESRFQRMLLFWFISNVYDSVFIRDV